MYSQRVQVAKLRSSSYCYLHRHFEVDKCREDKREQNLKKNLYCISVGYRSVDTAQAYANPIVLLIWLSSVR